MYPIKDLIHILYNIEDGFLTDLRRGQGLNRIALNRFFKELQKIEIHLADETKVDKELAGNLGAISLDVHSRSYVYPDPDENWEIREVALQIQNAVDICLSNWPLKLSNFASIEDIEVTPMGEYDPFKRASNEKPD